MTSHNSTELVDSQWLMGQRIGFAAFHLKRCHDRSIPQEREYLDYLTKVFGSRRVSLFGLPPSTWTLLGDSLSAIPSTELSTVLLYIRSKAPQQLARLTGRRLKGEKNAPFSRLRGAEIIAHNILNTETSGAGILRLGKTLLPAWDLRKMRWQAALRDERLVYDISLPLVRIRARTSTIRDRLAAVTDMTRLLERRVPHWEQVRNVLYHQLLSWPLVVTRLEHEWYGISLPILIDVSFSRAGKGNVEIVGDEALSGDDGESRERCRFHLRKAVDAAKLLWSHGHPSSSPSFQQAVTNANVGLDLELAGKIVGRLPIAWESAEAYCAQVVLGRLLGRRGTGSYVSSGATGIVGRTAGLRAIPLDLDGARFQDNKFITLERPASGQRKSAYFPYVLVWRGPIGTHEAETNKKNLLCLSDDSGYKRAIKRLFDETTPLSVLEPSAVWAKMAAGFNMWFFDRLMFPLGVSRDVNAYYQDTFAPPTAQAICLPTLEGMADLSQIPGWRGEQYVHCPDVAWELRRQRHTSPAGVPTSKDGRVRTIVRELRQNGSPIFECFEPPPVILSAVAHLLHDKTGHRRFTWVCVRILPTEAQTDERFWQLMWDVVGASRESFREFMCCATPEAAADILGKALTHVSLPSGAHPGFCSPDLLVLLGTKQLARNSTGDPVKPRPLAPQQVLQALANKQLARRRHLGQLLGRTRVICVNGDQELGPDVDIPSKLSASDVNLLHTLCTFRTGFTQGGAALVLRRHCVTAHSGRREALSRLLDIPLHDWLKRCECADLLRRIGDTFYVPHSIRKILGSPKQDKLDLARLHYSAGLSKAPYVSRSRFPSLSLDHAYAVAPAHEAEYEFEKSLEAFQDAGISRGKSIVADALGKINRFVEPMNWSSVRRLTESFPDIGWQVARDIAASYEDQKLDIPLCHLSTIVEAGLLCYKQKHTADKNRRDIERSLDLLIRRAVTHDGTHAGAAELISVKSRWATFLRIREQRREADAEQLGKEVRTLIQNENNDGQTVWPEWCEHEADREEDHHKAAEIYGWGVKYGPSWRQSWLKGAGAEILAKVPETSIGHLLTTLEKKEAEEILNGNMTALERLKDVDLTKVVETRWAEGMRLFVSIWKRDLANILRNRRCQLHVVGRLKVNLNP